SHSVSSSLLFFQRSGHLRDLHSFPTRRSSDLTAISLFEPELISDDTTRQIVEILKEGSEHLQETLNNHIDILSQQNSLHVPLEQDRKSTRLNSSHVKISYAVFCLKKKIKKTKY